MLPFGFQQARRISEQNCNAQTLIDGGQCGHAASVWDQEQSWNGQNSILGMPVSSQQHECFCKAGLWRVFHWDALHVNKRSLDAFNYNHHGSHYSRQCQNIRLVAMLASKLNNACIDAV